MLEEHELREEWQVNCASGAGPVEQTLAVVLPLSQRHTVLIHTHTHTHTHKRSTALCPGLPGWAGTRKVKPIWTLPKQETVSGSGISWAVCKSLQRDSHASTPPLSFLQAEFPSCRPTNSVKALKALIIHIIKEIMRSSKFCTSNTHSDTIKHSSSLTFLNENPTIKCKNCHFLTYAQNNISALDSVTLIL